MNTINVRKFGLSFGITAAILYLGCMLVMSVLSQQAVIYFFNSLIHGIDVTSIIRTKMPPLEMVMGIVEIFVIGWLTGATIASIYNYGIK